MGKDVVDQVRVTSRATVQRYIEGEIPGVSEPYEVFCNDATYTGQEAADYVNCTTPVE